VPRKFIKEKNKDQPIVSSMYSTKTTSNAKRVSSLPTFSEELKLAS